MNWRNKVAVILSEVRRPQRRTQSMGPGATRRSNTVYSFLPKVRLNPSPRYPSLPLLSAVLLLTSGCTPTIPQPTTTTLTLGPVLHTNVQRFGINLSGQTYYDSGQLLRNLTYRNPGFEASTWQSVLHCKTVTANTCTDENQWTVWPANFLLGARYEILPNGSAGTITASTPAAPPHGITLTLSGPAPPAGAFLEIHIDKPGNPEAGWWTEPRNGATLTAELHDLSPNTPGKQALRIEASAPNQSVKVSSFLDSYNNRSFLQLRGRYTLTFRAKSLSPAPSLTVSLTRLDTKNGNHSFLTKIIPLTPIWHDYTVDFQADEAASALGPIQLAFDFSHSSALLDDVALTEAPSPANPTAFRNAVVDTLRALHPGVLRYMDSGNSFGSSLANLLAPQFARRRTGASTQLTLQEDIAVGLPDFLTLCQAIAADPWIALPPGLTPEETRTLVAYLSPWTRIFHTIHLELGNEQWNSRSFVGATINSPQAYAQRAAVIFAAARATPGFRTGSYDLILGSWATVPWYTMTELAAFHEAVPHSSQPHRDDWVGPDSVAVAPYLYNSLNDTSSKEAIFGPMFAQPEQVDSRPDGYMAQQLAEATKAHTKLSVYEVNLSTVSGSATQSDLDRTVPSLGAGLTLADHMLLMLRDLGVTTQCLFSLPGYVNGFAAASGVKENTPLWGAVIDMGGPTNLRRPQFLALQMINAAILPTMLTATLTGPAHTWNQPLSPNDQIRLENAHALQTFAFADGPRRSLILLNLGRTESISLQLPPITGTIAESRLTGNLTDTNETLETLTPTHRTLTRTQPYQLPPHSLTTLTWTDKP